MQLIGTGALELQLQSRRDCNHLQFTGEIMARQGLDKGAIMDERTSTFLFISWEEYGTVPVHVTAYNMDLYPASWWDTFEYAE